MMTRGRVTAILGPTNTGKTHEAISRMLGHRTGVIGLPLRLLAREVYDRIVKARGPSVVALGATAPLASGPSLLQAATVTPEHQSKRAAGS